MARNANRLAALSQAVTGVDLMPGFLELARLHSALERAGLVDNQLLDENSQPLSAGSRQMVVIASKP